MGGLLQSSRFPATFRSISRPDWGPIVRDLGEHFEMQTETVTSVKGEQHAPLCLEEAEWGVAPAENRLANGVSLWICTRGAL